MSILSRSELAPRTPRAPEAARGSAVELVGVSRHYDKLRALDDLHLRLEPGELVALLGPSGCGKTTALRILAGFEHADRGLVLVNGREVASVPPQRRDMGMVFQSYSLFPTMSALDNVGFGLRLRGVARNERQRRARELLELVGLAEWVGHFPHQLSGGQAQRVALARALAIEPRVLLLDEPLSALDAKVRVQLREHIRALQQRLGITTLFVTHDQEEALSIADRVGVMRSGRLEQIGTPAEVYTQPATAFVASFVGSVNRLAGTSVNARSVEVLGVRLPIPPGQGDLVASRPVEVLLRPEALRVSADREGRALVTGRAFHGATMRITVRIDAATEVVAALSALEGSLLEAGTAVRLEPVGTPLFVVPGADPEGNP
ncbi:MAG: ABC transporter ATP-binding protein [Actinomycetota bacterium]|nr:ABC transporter ATP-binding protein [Actinomycetota bacterium]